RMIDVGQAKLYTLDAAGQTPENIDFVMFWGNTSQMCLVSPLDVDRLSQWEVGATINEQWLVKNETTFMKFGASYGNLYDDIKQLDDIKKVYDEALVTVKEQEGYSVLRHGPSIDIRELNAGDIVLMKTEKNVYAIAKVLNLRTGNSGGAKFAFKVDRRNET